MAVTIAALREWLDDIVPRARIEASASHQEAMNSYGAGYDRGYLDALEITLKFINGGPEGLATIGEQPEHGGQHDDND
jgi:hypothetical protein